MRNMANGKNKVIFYRDWISNFEDLTDEEAGKLIKHFCEYINDLNPTAPDRLTELLFKSMENTLKRDLKKWESVVERNRNNGKNGGRPKKEPKKPSGLNENPKKADSVSVSVTDTVNDIINKGVKKEKLKVFNDWIDYRKEIKKPVKSIKTIQKLINKFNSTPLETCVAAVNYSVENQYQGLIWEKFEQNGTTQNTSNGSSRPHEIGRQNFTEES